MTIIILLTLGLALGMFSSSMLLNVENCFSDKENFKAILVFGIGQGVLLYLGNLVGNALTYFFTSYEGLIGIIIMVLVAFKMIYESFRIRFKFKVFQIKKNADLFLLALAKGFHAFFIGIASLNLIFPIVNFAFLLIGFSILFSLLGIQAGRKWGRFSLANLAELLGGIFILISAIIFGFQYY
ncbi:MAG: manganese efflux pump [Bacteroidales bacterium]